MRRTLAIVLTVFAVLAGSAAVPAHAAVRPDFIDVSSNNPAPNLAVYAKSHALIAVKATEGTGYVWSAGGAVADTAHKDGVSVWHYDFVHLSQNPAAEAKALVAQARAHWAKGDELVEDLEVTDGLTDPQLAKAEGVYVATVKAAKLGDALIVYTGPSFINSRPQLRASVAHQPIWIAAYQSVEPAMSGLNVIAWQFTDHASVSGESATIDLSHDNRPVVALVPTFDTHSKRGIARTTLVKEQRVLGVALTGKPDAKTSKALSDLVHSRSVHGVSRAHELNALRRGLRLHQTGKWSADLAKAWHNLLYTAR